MELIKKIKSNIPFSLHDSRIMRMEVVDDSLTLYLDEVFEYTKDSEKCYPASMSFKGVDLEDCNVLVFNKDLRNGSFAGVRYGIGEYMDKLADAEFEILTETYGTYSAVLEGLMWGDGDEPVSAIISIWNVGDIVFKV